MSTIDDEVREPDQAKLTQKLGLRPPFYDQSGDYGDHPDSGSCSPWCWLARDRRAVARRCEYTHGGMKCYRKTAGRALVCQG